MEFLILFIFIGVVFFIGVHFFYIVPPSNYKIEDAIRVLQKFHDYEKELLGLIVECTTKNIVSHTCEDLMIKRDGISAGILSECNRDLVNSGISILELVVIKN